MSPEAILGGDVVVSASRVEESVLAAPVTVERVSLAQLQRNPQTEIMASLDRLKGVDVSRSSMLISSLSTRGFNSAKSERLVQLVDGFDYVAPTLSLYAGNLTGIPEIDVESVEIVYGANSALYGSNAFNGVVLFQSRDPFQDEGASAMVRGGQRGLVETQARWAQRVGKRFAYKLVGSYFEADDFISANYSTLTTIPGNFEADGSVRASDDPRGADVVNRYGEVAVVTPATCLAQLPDGGGCAVNAGALGLQGQVFTPGFTENDLVEGDFRARAARVGAEVGYLVTDRIKATLRGRYAVGNGIYQSSNRYAFDQIGAKSLAATVEGENWTVRGLVNDDDSGDTYDLGFLGSFMNRAPYQDPTTGDMIMVPTAAGGMRPLIYAERYGQVYAGTFAGAVQGGASTEAAYAAAQAAASTIYPTLGDPRFDAARSFTLANDTPGSSPSFKSDGQIYNADGQYRFSLPAGIGAAVGANYRFYSLNSQGTLYADGLNSPLVNGATGERATRDKITNSDYGGYLQLRRSFLDDSLTISTVGRVDNFENFDARFSPRVSAVYSFGAERQHNVRSSFSRAFRQPAQLDQYISLDVGSILLLGNIGNGYEGFAFTNGTVGAPISINPLKPEQMNSFEIGYKGLLAESLLLDVNYYRSLYTDFIGTQRFFGRETGEAANPAELAPGAISPDDPAFANRHASPAGVAKRRPGRDHAGLPGQHRLPRQPRLRADGQLHLGRHRGGGRPYRGLQHAAAQGQRGRERPGRAGLRLRPESALGGRVRVRHAVRRGRHRQPRRARPPGQLRAPAVRRDGAGRRHQPHRLGQHHGLRRCARRAHHLRRAPLPAVALAPDARLHLRHPRPVRRPDARHVGLGARRPGAHRRLRRLHGRRRSGFTSTPSGRSARARSASPSRTGCSRCRSCRR